MSFSIILRRCTHPISTTPTWHLSTGSQVSQPCHLVLVFVPGLNFRCGSEQHQMEGMPCLHSPETGVGLCEEGGSAGDVTAWLKGWQYLWVPFGTTPTLYPGACFPRRQGIKWIKENAFCLKHSMVTQESTQGDKHVPVTSIHEQHHSFAPQLVKILPVSRYALKTVKKLCFIISAPYLEPFTCWLVLVASCGLGFKVGWPVHLKLLRLSWF